MIISPQLVFLAGVALCTRPCGEMRVRSRQVRKAVLGLYGSRAGWETRSSLDRSSTSGPWGGLGAMVRLEMVGEDQDRPASEADAGTTQVNQEEEPVEGRFYAGPPPSAAVAYVNTWSPLDDCDASNGTLPQQSTLTQLQPVYP